ncbi:MAG: hypothetical protein Q9217_007011, partial [Psora testacea]
IGVNTEYLTVEQGTTKWIGVNTEYMSLETLTSVEASTTQVVTTSVVIMASTATASASGVDIGDVTITLPPSVLTKLLTLAKKSCGGPSNKRKRQTQSCAVEFARQVGTPGTEAYAVFQNVHVPMIAAADMQTIITAAGITGSMVAAVKLALVYWNMWATSGGSQGGTMPNAIKIPATSIGSSPTQQAKPTSTCPLCASQSARGCDNGLVCAMGTCNGSDQNCFFPLRPQFKLPNLVGNSSSTSAKPDACYTTEPLTAPQRDGDGTPSVQSSINDWCAKVENHKLAKQPGVDTHFQRYSVSDHSFWLSSNRFDGKGCGDEVKISKTECVEKLTGVMLGCDPDSGLTHGGSLKGNCIQFNITMSAGTGDDSPPWNKKAEPNQASTPDEDPMGPIPQGSCAGCAPTDGRYIFDFEQRAFDGGVTLYVLPDLNTKSGERLTY